MLAGSVQGNEQIFAGDDILIDLPTSSLASNEFLCLACTGCKRCFVSNAADFGYVDLTDIQSFLFASPPLFSDSIKETLTALHVKGDLQNTALVFSGPWNDWNRISLNANFIRWVFHHGKNIQGSTTLRH